MAQIIVNDEKQEVTLPLTLVTTQHPYRKLLVNKA